MNKKRIVNLVHQGFLDQTICVCTAAGVFNGKWYAVDLDDGTIELNYGDINMIIDWNQIIGICYNRFEVDL